MQNAYRNDPCLLVRRTKHPSGDIWLFHQPHTRTHVRTHTRAHRGRHVHGHMHVWKQRNIKIMFPSPSMIYARMLIKTSIFCYLEVYSVALRIEGQTKSLGKKSKMFSKCRLQTKDTKTDIYTKQNKQTSRT